MTGAEKQRTYKVKGRDEVIIIDTMNDELAIFRTKPGIASDGMVIVAKRKSGEVWKIEHASYVGIGSTKVCIVNGDVPSIEQLNELALPLALTLAEAWSEHKQRRERGYADRDLCANCADGRQPRNHYGLSHRTGTNGRSCDIEGCDCLGFTHGERVQA